MRDRDLLAQSIVLGLAIAHGSTRVYAEAEIDDGADQLDGLVARDAAELNLEQGLQADATDGACDPSGCTANLGIERLDFGDTSGLPFETRGALFQVGSASNSVAAAQDVVVRLTSQGSAILSSTGCIQIDAGTLDCPVGTLAPGQRSARSIEFRPTNPTATTATLRATAQSTTPDPVPGNNVLSVSSGTRQAGQRLARFTQFDGTACPAITADIEVTDPSGVPTGLFPQGPDYFEEVIDNGTWLGAPAIASADSAPLSVAILLDNSAASPAAVLQAVKQNVRQSVQAWWADATADGVPLPSFAIAATSSPNNSLDFTTDLAVFDAQLDAVANRPDATRLFDHLDTAAAALAQRAGRRAIIAVVASSDGKGFAGFVRELPAIRAGVPIYALAQNPRVEPLARQIAQFSKGFRYLADARETVSLAVTMDAIRSQSRLGWSAPSQGQPRRIVNFRQLNAQFFPVVQARGAYAQTETGCATACTVTRELPDRHTGSIDVSLHIQPGATPVNLALIEQLGVGWTVPEISDGGRFNPETNQIRWDGKSISSPTTFTYRAFPPIVQSLASFEPSDSEFSGTASIAGSLRPTCGESTSARLQPHPVDISAGYQIDLTLLEAYERAWRQGERWPRGEHPVPMTHLTRAGQIRFANAGSYVQEPVANPPWSWTGVPAGPYSVSAERTVPANYLPGESLTVQLAVQPVTGTRTGAIEEVPPAGWEIISVSDGGVFDPVTRTIRWGLFRDSQSRTVSYVARPPLDASGVANFTGRYSVDGEQREFAGSTTSTGGGQPALFFNGFE